MKLLLLGPVEASINGRPVNLGRRQERALMSILAVRPGQFVSADRLSDLLWDDRPPDRARVGLQAMVSHLRAALRAAGGTDPVLLARGGGYALDIDPTQVDLYRFRAVIAEADASTVAAERARLFGEAIGLWRGTPMSDALDAAQLARVLPDVDELHLAAREGLLEAQLDLGGHRAVIAELGALVAEQPLRERTVELLMVALHRAGRGGEALDAYASLAARLADELGVDPAEPLKKLHVAILRDDPALGVASRGAGPGGEAKAPAQLPAAPTPFVGRAEALAEIDALRTGDAGVVVVSGGAGIGKTALALSWAHRARAWFPDGQLFFDLRGYSRDTPAAALEVLGHLLIALGVPPAQVPADTARAAALFRTTVADRRILMVLDNVLSADQVRPLLPGSSGVRVLVTSRTSLAGLVAMQGARRVPLVALTPEQSRELLHQLLGDAVDADLGGELAEVCDHLPLALRIVAARLNSEPALSAAEHLDQLRQHRLASLAIDDDPSAAVHAAFELSYRRLPPAARRMFRVLGLVPGMGLTVAAAATLAATSDRGAAEQLAQLRDAHLALVEGLDRYAMHDLLRLYAAQQGAAEDSDADRASGVGRVFTWYLARASAAVVVLYPGTTQLDCGVEPAAFEDRDAAAAWLDTEHTTMIRLIVQGGRLGAHRPAALLADQLRIHQWARRYQIDWLTGGRAALASADTAGDPALRAAVHLSLAQARLAGAQYAEAEAHGRRAARLFARAGHRDGLRAALNSLGALNASTGNLPRATGYLEHSLAIATALGITGGSAAALSDLGNLYAMTGRLDLAWERSSAALALYREHGPRSHAAVTVSNLGAICLHFGRFDEAAEHLDAALVETREAGMPGIESATQTNLALLKIQIGRYDEAADHAERALNLARELGDVVGQAVARNAGGHRWRAIGDLDAARRDHSWALETARAAHIPEIEAEALVGLSLARTAGGHDGLPEAETALATARELGLSMLTVDALNAVAAALHQRGDTEPANEHARQALAMAEEMAFGTGAGNARRALRPAAG